MSHFFSSGCCLGTNSLGNNALLNASRLAACPLRGTPRQAKSRRAKSRRAKARRRLLGARLAKIAIALAVLFVVASGERWVLDHSATSASELVVATRMAELVVGESAPRTIPVSVEGGEWRAAGSQAEAD